MGRNTFLPQKDPKAEGEGSNEAGSREVLHVFLFLEQTARNGTMPYHWKAYCTMRNTD
jgi:hypothetical protein